MQKYGSARTGPGEQEKSLVCLMKSHFMADACQKAASHTFSCYRTHNQIKAANADKMFILELIPQNDACSLYFASQTLT